MEITDSKILHAIRQGQFKQLSLYLRHNYDIHARTKDGENGLFFALDIKDARKRRRMIRFCLDHGVDPLQKELINGYSPINEAIARQQSDSVQLFLANAGGEIDWRSLDNRGRTLLHQAVETNNVAIVEDLVRVMNHYGVSVDIPDRNGLTPFLLATKLHLPEMSRILTEKGRASRQQFDLVTFRTADEWEKIGMEERRSFVRSQLREEIERAKKEGKITRVKKLKQVYSSPLFVTDSVKTFDSSRRDSSQSTATFSSNNLRSSIPIKEIIDRLPEGEIPEHFASSVADKQTFYIENNVRRTLPIISSTTERQRQAALSLNALVDLFQVMTEQNSPSYRAPIQAEPKLVFDRFSRKKDPPAPSTHRSTLATLKASSNTKLSSTSRMRSSSNFAIPIKRTT